MSLAAAMTLGLAPGTFYRGARLGCINLLLTYPGGCKANCQFCGLAREKHRPDFDPKFEKFIRVAWRTWSLDEVVERCQDAPDHVGPGLHLRDHPSRGQARQPGGLPPDLQRHRPAAERAHGPPP